MVRKRITIQKIKILQYMRNFKTHPTADEVYNSIKKDIPTITLSTVYRNLNTLVDEKAILKLEINNESHFDGDISNHQHFVCFGCNKIFDLFHKNISEYALKNLDDEDFEISEVKIIFSGRCNKCKNQGG